MNRRLLRSQAFVRAARKYVKRHPLTADDLQRTLQLLSADAFDQLLECTMSSIMIECPDTILQALRETPEGFAREAQVLLAAKLYEIGRLSSGRAAELAGMGRVEFFDCLKAYQVPVANFAPEDLEKEFRNIRELRS